MTIWNNESEVFYNDPINASEELQLKYMGVTYANYKEPTDYTGPVEEGYKIAEKLYTNPFTKEQKTLKVLEVIPWYFENKAKDYEELNKQFEEKIDLLIWTYTDSERATFETKRVEAEKWQTTGSSFYITTLAEAKGRTEEQLVQKIEDNSKAYFTAYAKIEAWKDQEELRLKEKYNIS